MAKKFRQVRSLNPILTSPKLEAILLDLAEQVVDAASSDTNDYFVSTLDAHTFHSGDRVVGQAGAAPGIGSAVEAKRGTFARALGQIGA